MTPTLTEDRLAELEAIAEGAAKSMRGYLDFEDIATPALMLNLVAALRATREINRRSAEDWATDDTAIRDSCRPYLNAALIDGTPDGVPTTVDVVESLAAELRATRRATAAVRGILTRAATWSNEHRVVALLNDAMAQLAATEGKNHVGT